MIEWVNGKIIQMGKINKKEKDWEVLAEVKSLDSRNRVVFPPKVALLLRGGFDLVQNEKGEIKIIPMVRIPIEEAWIYKNPEVLKKIDKGMSQSRENKVRKISLDDL